MNNNYRAIRNETLDNVYSLPSKLQKAIVIRYGLDGERPRTFKEVSKIIGLTVEGTRRMILRGLDMLRMMHEQEVTSPDQLVLPVKERKKHGRHALPKKRYDFKVTNVCSSEFTKIFYHNISGHVFPWIKYRENYGRNKITTEETLKSLCYGTDIKFAYTRQYIVFVRGKAFALFLSGVKNMASIEKLREKIKKTYNTERMVGCYRFKFFTLESKHDMPRFYAELLATLAPETNIDQIWSQWNQEQYEEAMRQHEEAMRIEREAEQKRRQNTEHARYYRALVAQRTVEHDRMDEILKECLKRIDYPISMTHHDRYTVLFRTGNFDYQASLIYKHDTAYMSQYEKLAMTCKYGDIKAVVNFNCNLDKAVEEKDYQTNIEIIKQYLVLPK